MRLERARTTEFSILPSGACHERARRKLQPPVYNTMIDILAQAAVAAPAGVTGNLTSAFGLLGAAIGVGLIGFKAAEAVGRNPGASGKVLVQAIIGMALAEGLGILALFLG